MKNKEVWVRLKGDLLSFNTHCSTLKEAMETLPQCNKRSWIAEWRKQENGIQGTHLSILIIYN